MDAVKRVDRRHADQPRRQPTVEAGAFAVRVHHIRARVANEPLHGSKRQRERPERVDGHFGELDTERTEVRGEPLVPGTRDRNLELVSRETTNEIKDLAWAATERRRGEELQDANHGHIVTFAGRTPWWCAPQAVAGLGPRRSRRAYKVLTSARRRSIIPQSR